LNRVKGDPADPQLINLKATGFAFNTFTVGLQYKPIPQLHIGLVYRHGVTIPLKGESALVRVGAARIEGPITSDIVAPAMFGIGLRGDIKKLSLMLDVEYELHSQVTKTILKITDEKGWPLDSGYGKGIFPLAASYYLTDAINIKAGLEYRINSKFAVRGGYTWQGPATNPQYATPFGAPPGDTHIAALGFGYQAKKWQLNVAYNIRMSSADVTEEQVKGQEECNICAADGHYSLLLQGVHVDFSTNF
jgi:long-subunit fatty acid transport protein